MKRKRMLLFLGILVLTILLSGGLFVVLAAQEGTADDPLITKSYIDNVFKPEIMGIIDTAVLEVVGTETADIQTLIDSYVTQINNKIDEFNTSTGSVLDNGEYIAMLNEAIREKLLLIAVTPSSDSETFVLVSLTNGQMLTGQIGCEIIMRTGSAACYAVSEPGLINIPESSGLASDAVLQQNTLYMVATAGNGFTVTSNATFLVRGNYSVNPIG